MTDEQLLDRFAEALRRDPELGTVVRRYPGAVLWAMQRMGTAQGIVHLLDRAAQLWAAVREEQPCQT